MFEIDKEKFGAFVSALRREKGLTQKELAQQLYISDKAISKWETGVSIPDTALLIPLAELLGVTVTELLTCQRRNESATVRPEEVESLVKTAIHFSAEAVPRAYHRKSIWHALYFFCLLAGALGVWWNYHLGILSEALSTAYLLGAIFGGYFCFYVQTRLPSYYDSYRSNYYHDGAFRMNVPGVVFTNDNWPYIVRVGRIWACLSTGLYPLVNLALYRISPVLWQHIQLYVFLVLILGGLFIPVYIVGRKFE